MLIKGTRIKILDNSGALEAEIFCIYGGFKRRSASVGDVVKVAIKRVQPNRAVQKGQKFHALIISTVRNINRSDDTQVRLSVNAAILLDSSKKNPNNKRPDLSIVNTSISTGVAREAVEGRNAVFKKAASITTVGVH